MSITAPVRYLFSLLLVLLAAGGLWFALQGGKPLPLPAELQTSVLPKARPLESFQLGDQNGNPFGLERLKGKWSWLFFGYTHCPDICPTTLATLQGVAKKLEQGGELDDTQFVFVSVDPRRDTPEHLQQYLKYFHPAFIGVTGDAGEIEKLSRQVGVIYLFEGDTSRDDYIVNHTATLLLIDPQGRLYARINPPHTPQGLVDTYHRIRRFYSQ